MLRPQCLCLLGLLACLSAGEVAAQEASKSPNKAKAKKDGVRREPAVALTAERDHAARKFAEEHHPELAKLLKQLQESAPKEYAEAIAELDRSRDRLDKLRERQPERYDAELGEWKLTSRIRLTLARMAMNDDPQLAAELQAMVRERQELRLQLLKTEQVRIEKRLEKIRATLADYERDPEAAIERELATLKKGVSATQARTKSKGKPIRPTANPAIAKPAQTKPEKQQK